MKSKFLMLVFAACVGLFTIIAFNAASKNRQRPKEEPNKDRLKWSVAEAKKEGRQQVIISSRIVDYLGSENIDIEQALNDYTVVVAQPIAKRTYEVSDNDLVTWYRFRIVDPLTPLKNPVCLGCSHLSPPADTPPLDANEFLIAKAGGRLNLDGVEVVQTERGFPEFEDNQKYLLFVSLFPNGVAVPAGGPVGVFKLGENGNLAPVGNETNAIQEGIMSKFQGSLTLLKRQSKKR